MMIDTGRRVAIVGGARTPFAKMGTELRNYSALDLASHSVNGALEKLDLDPDVVDKLAYGTVVVNPAIPQLAREVNFQSELPARVRAITLTDNCITGTSAIGTVYDSIALGRADIGIACGVESMSNPPVLFTPDGGQVFLQAARARSALDRVKALAGLRPRHFKPWSYGIAEPSTGLTMGEHTEITVKEWNISQAEQDEIAWQSHMNAHKATELGTLKAGNSSPLMGPGIAVSRLLARNGLALADLDIIEMHRRDARLGLISVCGAGATAVAMLLERN